MRYITGRACAAEYRNMGKALLKQNAVKNGKVPKHNLYGLRYAVIKFISFL